VHELVEKPRLFVLKASADEIAAHEERLRQIDKASGGKCAWKPARSG
jgi:DNA polymerase-3 subunit epsilon